MIHRFIVQAGELTVNVNVKIIHFFFFLIIKIFFFSNQIQSQEF